MFVLVIYRYNAVDVLHNKCINVVYGCSEKKHYLFKQLFLFCLWKTIRLTILNLFVYFSKLFFMLNPPWIILNTGDKPNLICFWWNISFVSFFDHHISYTLFSRVSFFSIFIEKKFLPFFNFSLFWVFSFMGLKNIL